MNTRLEQFIAAENISQSQLADTLGVARASISHILAGRNKPGYEFITNLMKAYPALNIEWLLAGKGKMYKNPSQNPVSEQDLPHTPQIEQPEEDDYTEKDVEPNLFESTPEPAQVPVQQADKPVIQAEKRIVRVVAFYDDGTFREIL